MPLAHESMEEGRGSVGGGDQKLKITIVDVPIEASSTVAEKGHSKLPISLFAFLNWSFPSSHF